MMSFRLTSRRSKAISAFLGVLLSFDAAYAATSLWSVSLANGSSGEAQAATIQPLTITATTSGTPANLLYPGGTGDVVVQISNPNSFPVTISAVTPPTSGDAVGYSDNALTTAVTGCSGTSSLVTWTTATSGALTNAVTVAAKTAGTNGTLTVVLTGAATMNINSPQACAGTYFMMPSLTGITAAASNDTPSTSPTTDNYN